MLHRTGIEIGGDEYLRTSEVCERLAPDVTAPLLRRWASPNGGRPPLLSPVTDPDGDPVRLPGPSGQRENVWRWSEVLAVEHATRTTTRAGGRRRAA